MNPAAAIHRLRQFATAGRPPAAEDYALAREWLEPALFQLFAAQHPRDIVHTAATARWLLARGWKDPSLLQAALLHDIGKGEQRRIDRAAAVVARSWRVDGALSSKTSRIPLRRALERTRTHSERGATSLALLGAPARVVELTLCHHDPPGTDPVLALLQEADTAT